MTELRFHHEVYSVKALDEASRVFADVAEVEQDQHMPYFDVRLTATSDAPEELLAREFANYALGLTVEERRSGGSDAP